MIVDSQEDNITFYRNSFIQDIEPLDQSALTKQYKECIQTDKGIWSKEYP